MEYMGKKLEDIIVNLPYADGTTVECGVASYFQIGLSEYFALLPKKADGKLDFSQSYMLYKVEKDEENNPVVVYIESDEEYAMAATYFQNNYLS